MSRASGPVILALAAAFVFAVSASAQVTVLAHATVIDGTGSAPQNDVTLVLESGRIRDIGSASKIAAPAGATVLDLTGRFIVPSRSCPTPVFTSPSGPTAAAPPTAFSSRDFSSTGRWT